MKVKGVGIVHKTCIQQKNSETNCIKVYTGHGTIQECMMRLREVLVFDGSGKVVFVEIKAV